MKGVILKYRLWQPLQALRTIYYNLAKVTSRTKHAFLIASHRAVFDLDKTVEIHLSSTLVFGWCNMRSSNVETALCMGKKARLFVGGGGRTRANSRGLRLLHTSRQQCNVAYWKLVHKQGSEDNLQQKHYNRRWLYHRYGHRDS